MQRRPKETLLFFFWGWEDRGPLKLSHTVRVGNCKGNRVRATESKEYVLGSGERENISPVFLPLSQSKLIFHEVSAQLNLYGLIFPGHEIWGLVANGFTGTLPLFYWDVYESSETTRAYV